MRTNFSWPNTQKLRTWQRLGIWWLDFIKNPMSKAESLWWKNL